MYAIVMIVQTLLARIIPARGNIAGTAMSKVPYGQH